MSCTIEAGEVVTITPGSASILHDCDIRPGAILRLHYGDSMDPTADTPDEPLGPVPSDPPAPEPVASTPRGIADTPHEAPAQAQTLDAPDVADLSGLQDLAGGDSTMMLLLAVVAILGGGAAWKFYSQWSSQRHEQALARIELERAQAGLAGSSPPPCQVKHAEIEKRLDALDKRQQETARKLGLLLKQDGPTIEEMDERLVRLEKAARAARRE